MTADEQKVKVSTKPKTKINPPSNAMELRERVEELAEFLPKNIDFERWKISYFKQKTGKIHLKYIGTLQDKKGLEILANKLGLSAKDFQLTIWENEYEYAYQFVF